MAADDDLGPIGEIKIGGGRAAGRPPIISQMHAGPHYRRKPPALLPRLILAAILVAAIAFFVAPWFALWAVRSAAESHDAAALGELVDANAVRGGLKAQLSGAQAPAPVDPWKHPLEAMRQAFVANAPIGPNVDSYMTAPALNALLNGKAPGEAVGNHPWPSLRYWGFDRCRLAVADPVNPTRVTLLTFQRHGLYTWTLSQIRLPE